MATHANLAALFTEIANAIRTKTGDTGTLVADNFPSAIAGISTGAQYASGVISGNGSTSFQVNCGFQPDFFIIWGSTVPTSTNETWLVEGYYGPNSSYNGFTVTYASNGAWLDYFFHSLSAQVSLSSNGISFSNMASASGSAKVQGTYTWHAFKLS